MAATANLSKLHGTQRLAAQVIKIHCSSLICNDLKQCVVSCGSLNTNSLWGDTQLLIITTTDHVLTLVFLNQVDKFCAEFSGTLLRENVLIYRKNEKIP